MLREGRCGTDPSPYLLLTLLPDTKSKIYPRRQRLQKDWEEKAGFATGWVEVEGREGRGFGHFPAFKDASLPTLGASSSASILTQQPRRWLLDYQHVHVEVKETEKGGWGAFSAQNE